MNSVYESLYEKANGHNKRLEHGAQLLFADLPEAGSYWENLATTYYVQGKDWEGAARVCELAGDAWKHQEQRECAASINRYLSSGELRPRIGRVLPLSQAAEAHRLQEANTIGNEGTLSGKIVLTVDEP